MIEYLASTLLLSIVADRTGACIGAVFEEYQRGRQALLPIENEHIERAVRRAALTSALECIELAVDDAGSVDQLVTPRKTEYSVASWAAGQPSFYPAERAITRIKKEVNNLYKAKTSDTCDQPFLPWRDAVGQALDGIKDFSQSDAVNSIYEAVFDETLKLGEWENEPDGLRRAFENPEAGFFHHFKRQIHREFKDEKSPEFGKIYNALTQRAIEAGVVDLTHWATFITGELFKIRNIIESSRDQQINKLDQILLALKSDDAKNGGAVRLIDTVSVAAKVLMDKLSTTENEMVSKRLGDLSPDEIGFLVDETLKETGDIETAVNEINRNRDRRTILENTIIALKRIILDRHSEKESEPLKLHELEAMYTAVAIIAGPDLYQAYTEQSFDYDLWQDLIKQPQDLTRKHNASNHLHYSNILTANKIILDLVDRYQRGDLKENDTIRLLEAGSGGCNTSYAVIYAILNHPDLKPLELNIEFLAFEINGRFARWGDGLFRGQSWPTIKNDPRCKTLNHERIRTWPGLPEYVLEGDAANGIVRLLRDNVFSLDQSVDYFFSSYMIHHVPNGDAMLRFLLESEKKTIHLRYADFRGEAPANRFSDATIYYLTMLLEGSDAKVLRHERRIYEQMRLVSNASQENLLNDNTASVIEAVAYSLAWHIFQSANDMRDKEIELLRKSIIRSVERASQVKVGPYEYQWTQEFFHDPQGRLFMAIKKMLRPMGLMIIADPDGTSSFNSANAAKNDQMATELMVAQFRDFSRLSTVLRQSPLFLEIEKEIRIVKTKDGEFDIQEGPLIDQHSDLEDANLGYVLTARKHFTTSNNPHQFAIPTDEQLII